MSKFRINQEGRKGMKIDKMVRKKLVWRKCKGNIARKIFILECSGNK